MIVYCEIDEIDRQETDQMLQGGAGHNKTKNIILQTSAPSLLYNPYHMFIAMYWWVYELRAR